VEFTADEVDRHLESYPAFRIGTWEHCVYCGEPSECRDHVIPFSFLSLSDSKRYEIGPQALSCKNCNLILGNRSFDTFDERCKWISNNLGQRRRKSGPLWERHEINQLKGKLRQYVNQCQNKHQWLTIRWEWYDSDCYWKNLEGLLTETLLKSESPRYKEGYGNFFRPTINKLEISISLRETRERKEKDAIRRGALSKA